MDTDKQRFINWKKRNALENSERKIPTLMETLIGGSTNRRKPSRTINGFHEVLKQQMNSQNSVIVVSHAGAIKTLVSWLGVGTHRCQFALVHRRRVMFAVHTYSIDLLVNGLDIKGRNALSCACTGCGSTLCMDSTVLQDSFAIRCPLCKRNYCSKCKKESWRVVDGALTCGNCRKEAAEVKPGIEVNVSGATKGATRRGSVSDEDQSDEDEDDSSSAFDSNDEEYQMLSRASAKKSNEAVEPNEDHDEEDHHAFDDEQEVIGDTMYQFLRLTEFCDLAVALDDKAIGRRLFQRTPKTRPNMFYHLDGWLTQKLEEDPTGTTGELYVMGFRGNGAGDIIPSQICKNKAVFEGTGKEDLQIQINGGHLVIVGFILRLYPAERVSEAFAVLSDIATKAAIWDSLSEFREVTVDIPWDKLLSHNLHTYTDDMDPYA